jgi:hypothetical protein
MIARLPDAGLKPGSSDHTWLEPTLGFEPRTSCLRISYRPWPGCSLPTGPAARQLPGTARKPGISATCHGPIWQATPGRAVLGWIGHIGKNLRERLWPLHAEHLAMRHVPGMRQIHASTGVAQDLPALGGRGGARISSLTRSEQLHWQPSRRFIVATSPCRLIRAVLPAAYRYSATCQGTQRLPSHQRCQVRPSRPSAIKSSRSGPAAAAAGVDPGWSSPSSDSHGCQLLPSQ